MSRATSPSPAKSATGGCARCARLSRSRATIEIEHEPGAETQWDWVELPTPWGDELHLLQGRLPFSGQTRGVFAESEDEAHLVEAIDGVLRRLGGTARRWRIDRMATAVEPKTGRLQPAFAAVARYYGAPSAGSEPPWSAARPRPNPSPCRHSAAGDHDAQRPATGHSRPPGRRRRGSVRRPDHQAALENVVLGNFTSARPCPRKVIRPPSPEALAAAARLRDHADREVVVDLDRVSFETRDSLQFVYLVAAEHVQYPPWIFAT
ncbi:hypothetical protein [Candidatus Nephthysia bennettiae]|uniref:Uncharacterized protein n=1 Tax=Candidatus Nephthysia bennettiae TaxID=3127016 RepID=A0A934KCD3_9BACT|nr:hypothetical protein [Candidatus Dormibacteraeota bacterium]